MRSFSARALGIFLLLLPLIVAQPAAASIAYLFVPELETTAASAPGILTFKGVVENECGTTFAPGTYFQITSDGQNIEIPVGRLPLGQKLRFARTVQVPVKLKTPATLSFELIVPGSPTHDTPDHYVSPCTPTIVKP